MVALPPVAEEAALRRPPHRDGRAAVEGPVPLGPLVERRGALAELPLVRAVAVEVAGGEEGAGQEDRRVDGRELALPRPAPLVHVQEVVVEPAVADAVAGAVLRRVAEKADGGEGEPERPLSAAPPALHGDREGRQQEAGGGDGGWALRIRTVHHEPAGGVRLVEEVVERDALDVVEELHRRRREGRGRHRDRRGRARRRARHGRGVAPNLLACVGFHRTRSDARTSAIPSSRDLQEQRQNPAPYRSSLLSSRLPHGHPRHPLRPS